MHGNGRALGGGREVITFGVVADGDGLYSVLFVVRNNVDLDGRALASFRVELPQTKILFIDDGLAVAGNRREEEAAGSVVSHLDSVSAAHGNLPDVVDALEHFPAAGLDV